MINQLHLPYARQSIHSQYTENKLKTHVFINNSYRIAEHSIILFFNYLRHTQRFIWLMLQIGFSTVNLD